MRKQSRMKRLLSLLLSFSLLLTLLLPPVKVQAGGFETTTYAELVEKLNSNSEIYLYPSLAPDGDFGWPTEETTLTVTNTIWLDEDWEVPENITLVFKQHPTAYSVGKLAGTHTLTLYGQLRHEMNGNDTFLDCNIIFHGTKPILFSNYGSLRLLADRTWTVPEGAELKGLYPNSEGTLVPSTLWLEGTLTGDGTVNARIDSHGTTNAVLSGSLTLLGGISVGWPSPDYEYTDLLTIPKGSVITVTRDDNYPNLSIANGTLNLEGELQNIAQTYMQNNGTLHINGGKLTTDSINVQADGTLFLDQGGEVNCDRFITRAGSTFRLAGEYTLEKFLLLWTNESDATEGTTLQLDETGVLYARNPIEVSSTIGVPGKITGSGTILLYGSNSIQVYDNGNWESYKTNPGNIPNVDPTVKIETYTCPHTHTEQQYDDEYHYIICKDCNLIIGAMEEHTMTDGDIITEPTCTEAGSRERVCSVCGYEADATEIPALGHLWDTDNCLEEASCIREGCDAVRLTLGYAVIKDGTAALTLSDGNPKNFLDNVSGNISVDLSFAKGTEKLILPGNLISELSKSDKADSLTVSTENVSVAMSAPVLDTVAAKILNSEDTVAVTLKNAAAAELNEKQQAALASLPENAQVVDVSLVITHADGSSEILHELGGNVTVSVPYETLSETTDGRYAAACHIADSGAMTSLFADCAPENHTITFRTAHFSDYAVFFSNDPSAVVNGGSGSGFYKEGTSVVIKADDKVGYIFDKWNILSGNVTLTDAEAAETTFQMPAENVEVEATYIRNNPFTDVKEHHYWYEGVLWAYSEKIISGTGDTTFSPKDTATRGDMVSILWRQNGSPNPTISNPFTDIKESNYYYKAILWAYENGIIKGKGNNTVAPKDPITRGEFVSIMHRMKKEPEASIENPFEDVKTSHYWYHAVLWAFEKEITKGIDATHFNPKANCTRGDIATFLYNAKDL